MPTSKRKRRLRVMVELPKTPASRIVTTSTTVAECVLVEIVFGMATRALYWSIQKCICFVAAFTSGLSVLSE